MVDALLRRAEDRLDRLCQQVRAKISREMDDATCKLLARAAPGSEFLAAESAPVLLRQALGMFLLDFLGHLLFNICLFEGLRLRGSYSGIFFQRPLGPSEVE